MNVNDVHITAIYHLFDPTPRWPLISIVKFRGDFLIAANTSDLLQALGEPVETIGRARDVAAGFSARDRRRKQRFPLELDLTIRVGTLAVPGRTVDISSSGMLVQTALTAGPGTKMTMAMAWPQLLDNRVPLRLYVHASVVRASEGFVAVTIERPEFRTVPAERKAAVA